MVFLKKYKNLILVLPAFFFFFVGIIYPLFFGTIPYSFYRWNLLDPFRSWVGFKNYASLFTEDSQFFHSLTFTLKYGCLTILGANILAFFLSFALNEKLFAKSLIRAFFFIPNIISSIFVGLTWVFIFTGVVPSFLETVGLKWSVGWFGTPRMAMIALVIVTIWQAAGFLMIIYLAGLQTIPKDVIESAYLDGASGFKKILYIQLPLLMPTVTINLFISIAGAFKQFDIPYTLTHGGPYNSTETVAFNIYSEAFSARNLGYGSAKAVILLIIVCVITFVQLRITRGKEVNL